MSEKDNGIGSFLAGAVVGGVIGAGVALLLAPQSGEETRKMIKKKAGEIGDEFDEFKKEVGPKIEKAKKDLAAKVSKK